MIPLALALFGALFTIAVALALGTLLLRALELNLYREEERFLGFVTGAACLSLIVFVLAAVGLARAWVFLILGVGVLALARQRGVQAPTGKTLPSALSRWPRIGFWTLYAAFAIFYFATALAPEVSPDGSAYHLGLVSRYAANHGFFETHNMYARLSQGAEMLFLFAFTFGRHSAAALVHFAFYLALPPGMLAFGRRFRFPNAAATGALLFFMAPIVAFDGASAYIDVALACVLFALFYLLQIWDGERTYALLILIGFIAGFAYAVKYTGFLALPYAAGFVAWKLMRKRVNPVPAVALVSGFAVLLIAPWMVKNWLAVGNPLAPFYNSWFPNPYFHIGSELQYRAYMANWGDLAGNWEIPLEVTVRGGRLQGLLGPAFLLAPVALAALLRPAGRQLLLAAAVFTLTYPANIGTRFLIPMLPFLALAMGLAVSEWRWAAPLLIAFHACTTWPVNLKRYCDPGAMRIEKFPRNAALRIEAEPDYVDRKLPKFAVSREIEQTVPPGARVLCFGAPPEAYTSRELMVGYQSALAENLTEMLTAVKAPHWHPKQRYSFHFPGRQLRRIRVTQTASAADPNEYWTVNELHVQFQGHELARAPQWRITARPNPWEIGLAFDNNPMTRWRSYQRLAPGMYIEVDLGFDEQVDAVTVDGIPFEGDTRVSLEAWSADGRRVVSVPQAEMSEIAPPPDMRRWVGSEIRWNGIEYVLIDDSDWVADEIRAHAAEYGFTQVFETKGSRLYRISLDK